MKDFVNSILEKLKSTPLCVKQAPYTDHGCWCCDYEIQYREHRYWHRAFCISMFVHGLTTIPIILAILEHLFG